MAGYSDKTGSQASTLMANPKVRSYLKRRQDDLARRLQVTQEKIVEEMAVLAFSKPTDYLQWHNGRLRLTDSAEIPDCLVSAMKSLKPIYDKHGHSLGIEVSFHDKIAAAKLLAQHLGMLETKQRGDNKGLVIELMERLHEEAGRLEEGEKQI